MAHLLIIFVHLQLVWNGRREAVKQLCSLLVSGLPEFIGLRANSARQYNTINRNIKRDLLPAFLIQRRLIRLSFLIRPTTDTEYIS